MGVSNLNAEMLLANYFSAGMLASYAKALGKSDKGGAATLAERIAREWAKPSFAPPASTAAAAKRTAEAEASAGDDAEGSAKRQLTALEEIKAKRAKQAAKQAGAASSSAAAPPAATSSAAVPPAATASPAEPTAAPAAPRQFEVRRSEGEVHVPCARGCTSKPHVPEAATLGARRCNGLHPYATRGLQPYPTAPCVQSPRCGGTRTSLCTAWVSRSLPGPPS